MNNWLNDIHIGDAHDVLKDMPDESVDMVVTSPPYWGLRDYGEEGQLGLEDTPGEYVKRLVEIFSEIKRVLKPSGTVWLNLGDSYFCKPKSSNTGGLQNENYGTKESEHGYDNRGDNWKKLKEEDNGLKNKDLVGIPWRVAFALQEDGWYLRNDIIWHKPNPMPESVKDRCTTSHEHIFLLSKNKQYFYDADAIREPYKKASIERAKYPTNKYNGDPDNIKGKLGKGITKENVESKKVKPNPNGRNKRDVWEMTTHPFSGSHFAVFPPELPETCIKAGCPPKVCAECRKPYERDVETERKNYGDRQDRVDATGGAIGGGVGKNFPDTKRQFKGWKPTCDCDTEETEPGIVLDPFIGAGTTGMVAEELNRNWVGIDISEEYRELALERIENGDEYIRKKKRKEREIEQAKSQNHDIFEFVEAE